MTKRKIDGQFIPHTVAMISSTAWAALSLSDRRVLDCLELEHAAHAGKDNGSLICTHRDFQRFGVRKDAITTSLNTVAALGFVEIARRGRGGNGADHPPNRYRLTYLPAAGSSPTDDWLLITTEEQATTIAKGVRGPIRKKQIPTPRNGGKPTPRNGGKPPPETGANPPDSHPPKRGALSRDPLPGGRRTSLTQDETHTEDDGLVTTQRSC